MKNQLFFLRGFCVLLCFFSFSSIKAQLKADFKADIVSGCSPLVVGFSDLSTGNPTDWKWDLGNGGTSSLQHPGSVYIEPGTYTIRLIVSDENGKDSVEKISFITVFASPDVDFSVSHTEACNPFQIGFTDKSQPGSGSLAEWIWDFGDGQISTSSNPQHTYRIADTFGVTLTVKNSVGCQQTLSKLGLVTIHPIVGAGFSFSYPSVCEWPVPVQFNDSTLLSPGTRLQWLFGDGSTSAQASPLHKYKSPGEYPVQLITTTDKGCSDTVSQLVSVQSAKADFSVPVNGCINTPISFASTSQPEPLSVTWVFDNGDSAYGLSASHVFNQPGTYQVKMTADFGTCLSSVTKNVTIVAPPTAAFSIQAPETCSVPASIKFNNASVNAVSYTWLFGDGSVSKEKNPFHEYKKAGYYNVSLIAVNASGCSDTIEQKEIVRIGPPKISRIENLPVKACVPFQINPKPIINTPEKITSYQWDFGDGSSSTAANPTHQYTVAGVYQIKLKVVTAGGCTDSIVLKNAVTVSHPAEPRIGDGIPHEICASSRIQFTDASTGTITGWWWDFGDGTGSADQNPSHQYKDTGRFQVILNVENSGCKSAVRYASFIKVMPPIARFTSTVNCDDKYNRAFSDKSIGSKAWSWDFGDGNKSNLQNPSHTYSTTGTYTVKLVVTNDNCSDEFSQTIQIIDEHPSFSTSAQKVDLCRNDSVFFTAANFNPAFIHSMNWDFGDEESTGFLPNNTRAAHAYVSNGQYVPRLIVRDKSGCIDTIENSALKFAIYGPTARFTNPAGTCIGGTISFVDQSVSDGLHEIIRRTWSYGDGKEETVNGNPSHKYESTGNFNVKLVVNDAYGCADSVIKNRAVIITKPVADFTVSDSIRCSNNKATFEDASQGLALKYSWNFGDGSRSIVQKPVYSYANEGIFDVSLKITDRFGCTDSIVKTGIITISNPLASFELKDTFSVCPPLLVQPTSNSSHFTSFTWDFGDGNTASRPAPSHLYTNAGNFELKLIVKGHGECYDTTSKNIIIKGPSGKLEYAPLIACNPAEVSFSATTLNTDRIIWDFNDGLTIEEKSTRVSHVYNEPGKYLPKIVLIDEAGCKVGIMNKDTITIAAVNAGISFLNQAGCDSSTLQFADSSLAFHNKISSYRWNFGDNVISTAPNPSHTYYQSGSYTVSLLVRSDIGCTDSFSIPVKVQVNKSPKANILAPDSVCMLSNINFKASELTNDKSPISWSWNFGNGAKEASQNPVINYPVNGNYTVTVSATNQFGCINTATHPLTVIGLPKVNAGRDTVVCLGNSMNLHASGASKYVWYENPLLSCVDCPNPLIKPSSSQTFFVMGTNAFGCQASDSVYVKVNKPMPVSVSDNDTLCLGEFTSLKAKGASIYKWQPGIYLDNVASATPVFYPAKDTAITYQVIGWDDQKCFADTASLTMKVYPVPQMEMEKSDIILNVGSSVQLKTKNSTDVTQWRWSPATGLDDPRSPSPLASPKESITYTCVAANDGACIARSQVSVKVLCNDANIFVPNTFSPNSDGMNDVFFPRGKGLFNIKSMRVFNRWGQIVFEKNNFSPNKESDGWDGTSNGKPLNADVYVYIIEVLCENSSIIPVKGDITLIR